MEKTAKGAGSAGILAALFRMAGGEGSHKAYPEELTNIEAYTKGKVKEGDVIDASNVELVQDLIDPALYQEITQDNRKFWIGPTQTDIEQQFPPYYLDATMKNWGKLLSVPMVMSILKMENRGLEDIPSQILKRLKKCRLTWYYLGVDTTKIFRYTYLRSSARW